MRRKYRSHTESGHPWIGKIPEYWTLTRVGQVFKQRSTKVSDRDFSPLSVTKMGIIPQLEHVAKTDDNDNRKLVKAGDFVINSRSDRKGSSGIADTDGSVSLINTVLQITGEVHPRFCHHLMRSTAFQEEFYRMGNGLVADLWSTNFKAMKGINLPLPPLQEQISIAQFLDVETRHIDDLIQEKSRFIDLLQEKRIAEISHAVTRGLDPDVPMKPSGVEWIGDIPASWKLTKLGYLGRSANGINIGGEAFGSGFPFVSYGDVYKNRQLPTKVKGLVASTKQDQRAYSVQEGDVFFTRTSETIEEIAFPSVCMQNIPDAVFAGFLIRLRPYEGALVPGFSKYAFQNRAVRHFFAKEMKLVTRASLSQGLLQSLPIPLPPIEEQEKIAEHLAHQEQRFTDLVSDTERSIALLKEKRAALITAAVTGKIDVRSAA